MAYEFINGGEQPCAMCQALEGIHENPPGRPHDNCQCELLEKVGWHKRHEHPDSLEIYNTPDGAYYTYHIALHCCGANDQVIEQDITIEVPYVQNSDGEWQPNLDEEQVALILDAAYEQMGGGCDPCPQV